MASGIFSILGSSCEVTTLPYGTSALSNNTIHSAVVSDTNITLIGERDAKNDLLSGYREA